MLILIKGKFLSRPVVSNILHRRFSVFEPATYNNKNEGLWGTDKQNDKPNRKLKLWRRVKVWYFDRDGKTSSYCL